MRLPPKLAFRAQSPVLLTLSGLRTCLPGSICFVAQCSQNIGSLPRGQIEGRADEGGDLPASGGLHVQVDVRVGVQGDRHVRVAEALVPHLAAAITGTAALLHASGLAFETVKFLGVAYLLYMAWSTWRDKSVLSVEATAAPQSAARVIRSAVLINLLNPKLTIFFVAFLPQFVASNSPHALARLLGLSAVFMLMTFVVFALYGGFAASVRTHLIERPRIVDRLRRLFALSFVALSAKLATTSRT